MASSEDTSDIDKANAAWTAHDVQSSARGVAARHGDATGLTNSDEELPIMTPDIDSNSDQSLAVIGIYEGMKKFWKRYGPRFSRVWTSMTAQAKENLLLTVGPEMPRTKGQSGCEGQLLLLPEFIVEDLVGTPSALIDLMERSVETELHVQYFNDAQMIRPLVSAGVLQGESSEENYIALLQGGSHVGQVMQVDTGRAAALGEDVWSKMNAMVSKGFAIEGPVWGRVIERRYLLLSTLAIIMDEMRTEVFGKDAKVLSGAFKCSLPTCTETKCSTPDGRQTPLLVCSRCKVACYCSKEHQKMDWPRHREWC